MNILQFFIVPVIVVLIVHVIMSSIYKDAEKKDKGFVFNGYKLSYRRSFFRSIWAIPFILLLYIAIYWFGDLTTNEYIAIGIIFMLLALSDIATSYVKWKKNEKKA
ncbi:hypothetical protein [Planococcus notacanthi]|uniref:ATPase n=1 Tax=Planococcus notacanthi TaxID=3035188 RepID=A0ABT7ZPW3_9BACL|nr:hypothetical protein [Planococcus sp. APC 4016]MDN3429183.1 hypothetical protein [Planococcus sp. APC 4016]